MKKIISMLLTLTVCFSCLSVPAFASDIPQTEIDTIAVKSNGKILTKDVDYYLTYENNVKVGTGTVVVNFIGNYSGEMKKNFNIIKNKVSGSGSLEGNSSSISVSNSSSALNNTMGNSAYITGYFDGTFRPNNNMSRAEAAAIFARLISERKDENISGISSFADTNTKSWYDAYVGYLEQYSIIKGYSDGTFKPNDYVSRAEFVAMTVRYYDLFDEIIYPKNQATDFSDVDELYWAIQDISFALSKNWIAGYTDGTFKANNNISRAEVVTIINHVTERNVDKEYINTNLTSLHTFNDVKDSNYWAFYDIMAASNLYNLTKQLDNEVGTR